MRLDTPRTFVQSHPGLMMIPMFGAMGAMFAVYWKRHSHPLNIILLGVFTLLEAVTLGSVVGFYDQTVVLQGESNDVSRNGNPTDCWMYCATSFGNHDFRLPGFDPLHSSGEILRPSKFQRHNLDNPLIVLTPDLLAEQIRFF